MRRRDFFRAAGLIFGAAAVNPFDAARILSEGTASTPAPWAPSEFDETLKEYYAPFLAEQFQQDMHIFKFGADRSAPEPDRSILGTDPRQYPDGKRIVETLYYDL